MTLNEEDYPRLSKWACFSKLKVFKIKIEAFLKKKMRGVGNEDKDKNRTTRTRRRGENRGPRGRNTSKLWAPACPS